MLNLSKNEIKLKMVFLHFLYLCKINKERRYIARNGKMPVIAEKEDSKTGYKAYCLITLRSFLGGLFNKEIFDIVKSKYQDEYNVSPKNGKFSYGVSELVDNLIWLGLMRDWSPGISNLDQWNNANHTMSLARGNLSTRYGSSSFNLNYRVNFNAKVQTFIPVAFDAYGTEVQNMALNITVAEEKAAYANLTHRLLNKLKDNQFLKRELVTAPRVVANMDEISTLAMKYRVPKTVLETFLEQYRNILSGSRGLSAGAVFEYTKNINNNLHERLSNLEYQDFEDMAA
jgi:hypothetical protein